MSITPNPVFQIVYVSSARVEFSTADLTALLAKSRARNGADGISGLLLYHDGNFMQLLEGGETAVRATYERITRDPRHGGFLPLIQKTVTERLFPDWSMGFRDFRSAEVRSLPGYSTFLDPKSGALPTDAPGALRLLDTFRTRLR